MLKTITDRGVRLVVASNKYQDGAEKLVSHFFGEYDFVKILGQRDGQPIKPDPAIVDQILADVPKVAKEQVVYVGDSNVDMQTGANAGVRTVGVSWGFRTREELAAYSPSAIVDTPEALPCDPRSLTGSFWSIYTGEIGQHLIGYINNSLIINLLSDNGGVEASPARE